ncbi:MAG TPA: hypothetical protein VN493_30060 [Thermoanaerobaculia bacterium]|nr:hypothetical protein [Thermoanaerobaculia bacterium]
MTIKLALDREYGRLELDALLGRIEIADGFGIIEARCTYIDSWLDALIRGLQAIRAKSCVVIDLVDEPHALVFEILDGSIMIAYKNMRVSAGSIESFTRSLEAAASSFLEMILVDIGNETSELTEGIRKFVEESKNPEID